MSFNATGLSGQSTAINALTYSDAGGEKIIEATIAMYITPSASPTRWTALSFFSTNGFLAQLLVLDTAIIGNGPTTTGTLAINQGTWHSFRLHLDFASQTMTGYADSALIGELPFSILAHDLTQVRFGVNTLPGANTAYFDDLIITSATPEPTELTWLGLGAIIALLRRRKKAEHTNHHDF